MDPRNNVLCMHACARVIDDVCLPVCLSVQFQTRFTPQCEHFAAQCGAMRSAALLEAVPPNPGMRLASQPFERFRKGGRLGKERNPFD
jgi:hypothetical protein